MARTAGSISIVSMKLQKLVELTVSREAAELVNPNIWIDVSRKWIESILNPQCECVMIDARDIQKPLVEGEVNAQPIEMKPRELPQPVAVSCVPREFELTEDDLSYRKGIRILVTGTVTSIRCCQKEWRSRITIV
jgi:hypothetical protein